MILLVLSLLSPEVGTEERVESPESPENKIYFWTQDMLNFNWTSKLGRKSEAHRL